MITIALGACGSSNKSGNADAPVVPATIMISGTAAEVGISGLTPVAGVVVEAYSNSSDTTVVATATTDAAGTYSLTITTNGVVLDGYLKATKSSYMTTYLSPPAPLAATFAGGSVRMISPLVFNFLSGAAQASQTSGMGFVAMIVDDSATMPVSGASVSSEPQAESYRYNDSSGRPTGAGTTVTAADGIGYMFNVPPGEVTVSAMKSGSTFKSHPVNVRADVITTTLVAP